MKKLNFLKALIDFAWIMMCLALPLIFIFAGIIFFSNETFDIPVKISGSELKVIDFKSKIVLLVLLFSAALLFYGLYLFKKLLRLFQQKIIFDFRVVTIVKRIGYVVCAFSLLSGISNFIIEFWERKFTVSLGFNSYVLLFALGLFFLVLSEVFVIANKLKEENDLTF